ncbi:MAG: oxidoreductase [Ilumatobacteraceae bacterium]|nr:oxidoreductase [Ilumatobacteraceae bacterium]
MEPWIIPGERYYYGWYAGAGRQDLPHSRPDSAIKAEIVERLRQNPHTAHCHLRVDVKQAVVILQGDVPSRVAKRTAGDDCWDTLGVADVSNQLSVAGDADQRDVLRVRDVMTADPVALLAEASLRDVAAAMRNGNIGDVVLIDADRHPVGIITDRDIVVGGLAAGRDADTPASELCGPMLHTVRPDALLAEAIQVMVHHSVRRVPVVEDGHLLGIVTLADLARRRDPGSVLASIATAEPTTVPH